MFLVWLVCLVGLCHGAATSVLHDGSGGEGVVARSEHGDMSAEECTVVQSSTLKSPHKDNLLAFIIPGQELTVIFNFKEKNKDYCRDVLELSNLQATHKKVRLKGKVSPEQESSIKDHILPHLIPEGWNTFRFETNESSLQLTLTTAQEINLLQLTMDYPIAQVFTIGNFSVCSGDSPEWQVNEGELVTVPLHLTEVQHLEVNGDGSAEAYLKLPENHKYVPVSTNTSLKVITKPYVTGSIVEVVQNGKEEPYIEHSRSWPVLFTGNRRGTTRLRLRRDFTTPSPTATCSYNFISNGVLGSLLAISTVANLLFVLRFFYTKLREKGNTSHGKQYYV